MQTALVLFARGLVVGLASGIVGLNAVACSSQPGAAQTIATTVAVPGGAASFNGTVTLGANGNWTGSVTFTVPGQYTDCILLVQIEGSSGAAAAGTTTVASGGGGTVNINVSDATVQSQCGSPPYYICIYVVCPPTKLLYKQEMK